MTILPIIERELRGGARRKSTRRIRVWATVAAIVVAAGFLLFSPDFKSVQAGQLLFQILTAYGFGLCLLAGVFVTSDCLSEEKRAGTLGLLFLTDLRSYGIVLGKFIARALNPLLAWLAILPVISLALLLGGVTGAEFSRVSLALLNTLFLSLAVGICVSAFSRDAQRASITALALLVFSAALAPLAHALATATGWGSLRWAHWGSPLFNYRSAMENSVPGQSWIFLSSLMVTHALGWLWLAVAIFKINSVSKDDQDAVKPRVERRAGSRRRQARRAGDNPVSWLMAGGPGLGLMTWGLAIAWAVTAFSLWGRMNWPDLLYGSKAVGFLLKVIFVTQVCRFFIEARRSGSVEMLFCTPITEDEILSAHVRHLRRYFLGPLMVFLLPMVMAMLTGREFGPSGANAVSTFFGGGYGFSTLFILGTVTDFLALGAVGLWLALTMNKPALAPGTTVLCVLIAPLFLFFIPDFFCDMLLFLWARERLGRGFRRRLSEQVDASHISGDENIPGHNFTKRLQLELSRRLNSLP